MCKKGEMVIWSTLYVCETKEKKYLKIFCSFFFAENRMSLHLKYEHFYFKLSQN